MPTGAKSVRVNVAAEDGVVRLTVADDGAGVVDGVDVSALERAGHLGLAGMHERLAALGGKLSVRSGVKGGAVLVAEVPCL